ncbi:MAG: endonuclease [Pseudomonadota bacterium]
MLTRARLINWRFLSLSFLVILLGCDQLESEQAVGVSSKSKIANYQEARSIFWRGVYPSGFDTLYCGVKGKDPRKVQANIEHVFPMSWVTNALDCGTRKQCRDNDKFNQIESDLHNLYPALTQINKVRSSFKFGMVAGESRDYGARCDFELDTRQRAVEPRPAVRGDIARAMFYMQNRYGDLGLKIFSKQAALLKEWHLEDPPDAEEQRRNDTIERLQGNRNPYIDEPSSLR